MLRSVAHDEHHREATLKEVESPSTRRWPSSERFVLSARGAAVEARYRADIVTARATGGRESFDAARSAWCESYRLEPDDGAYLGELRRGAVSLARIHAELAQCGQTRKRAVEAMTRLLDLGLVEPAPRTTASGS
jgi:hypothetical protein